MLCAYQADGGDQVSLQYNQYESPDWSLFPRDFALITDLWLLAWAQLFTIAHIVISLLLHIFSFLHPR